MGNMILLLALLLAHLTTFLFGSVILRCDYSTSANPQEVLVTWRYKSFCKDPVLEYYSTGQDPANDCPDRQRTLRTVVQKRGTNEAMLGAEYRERKITILNNWLTVLFIILGALLLILLLGVCCCQCCPQKCCCYIRCPCCPRTCCCPEKAVMQHRMIRDAQKMMPPWMHGQAIYPPISSNGSMAGQPLLYRGSFAEYPTKQNFAMAPMGMQPPLPPPVHHSYHGNGGHHQDPSQVLDYLEHQVRGMDVPPTMMAAPHPAQQHRPPPRHHHHQHHLAQPLPPQAVPFTPGPPSMLSALDEMGVRGVERRVITLPPIVQRPVRLGGEEVRGGHRLSSQSSGSSQRQGGGGGGRRDSHRYREPSSPRRGILRGYSDDSDWESRRGGGGGARGGVRDDRGGSVGRRGGGGGSRASRQRAPQSRRSDGGSAACLTASAA
ncbi:hypothetical protein CRUP_011382 [Coryphaenoides rupestris]|nr:hypothetical protein CRUP_011382 [Coryphaenoides rupestris]